MFLDTFKTKILPQKDRLFRLGISISGNADMAEDVVQEVLIKSWQHRERWNEIRNIEAWLYSLTRNLTLDKLRSKHQKTQALDANYDIATYSTPETKTIVKDQLFQVYQVMKTLPEKQQACVQLRDIEGYTYKEIEEQTGIPLQQIKTYLYRGRKQLRTKIKELQDNEK